MVEQYFWDYTGEKRRDGVEANTIYFAVVMLLGESPIIQTIFNMDMKRRIAYSIAPYLFWEKGNKINLSFSMLFGCVVSHLVCNFVKYKGKELNNF